MPHPPPTHRDIISRAVNANELVELVRSCDGAGSPLRAFGWGGVGWGGEGGGWKRSSRTCHAGGRTPSPLSTLCSLTLVPSPSAYIASMKF